MLLDFPLTEYVDDLGSWVDALFDELASDFVGVWTELGDRAPLEMEVQRLHGIGSSMWRLQASVAHCDKIILAEAPDISLLNKIIIKKIII